MTGPIIQTLFVKFVFFFAKAPYYKNPSLTSSRTNSSCCVVLFLLLLKREGEKTCFLSLSLSLSLCVCVSYKITHGERTKVRESAKTDVVHLVLVVCVLLVSSRARCKVMNSLANSSFFSPL